ncbi:MAG: DJ-1/PfpI family protein [Lachnospiraceae bacterium]|nr:DJ-1/PfpI family protein [Lachnospiraceae bacterium]
MAEALIFLAEGYEECEMLIVVDMLRRAKIDIDMVSITDKKEVTSSHNVTIKADKTFNEADFSGANALILPGGMPGTLNLKACEALRNEIVKANDEGKVLAAICAAPTVYSSMGLLKDKEATCYPSMADELKEGANYIEKSVVHTDNFITSRGMGTTIDFAGEIIATLRDKETADSIKKAIVYLGGE